MVQRYSFERYSTTELTEPVLVDFVKYEDYAELERKLRNFADQVLYAPCSKVTEEMAMEILGL